MSGEQFIAHKAQRGAFAGDSQGKCIKGPVVGLLKRKNGIKPGKRPRSWFSRVPWVPSALRAGWSWAGSWTSACRSSRWRSRSGWRWPPTWSSASPLTSAWPAPAWRRSRPATSWPRRAQPPTAARRGRPQSRLCTRRKRGTKKWRESFSWFGSIKREREESCERINPKLKLSRYLNELNEGFWRLLNSFVWRNRPGIFLRMLHSICSRGYVWQK